MSRNQWLALLVTALIIVISTGIRWATVWDYGLRLTPDSVVFISTVQNFYQGDGLVYSYYRPTSDGIVLQPVTHWPPLIFIVYSIPLWLGASLSTAPIIVSLVLWGVFLAGLGWLTYRLCNSMLMMVCAMLIATIAIPFVYVFQFTSTEIVFLPLLVLATAAFTNLPQQKEGLSWQLLFCVVLLSLLLMTRYTGMFLYAGVVLWWTLWRIYQRRMLVLGYELPLFGLGTLPFIIFLIRNIMVSGNLFGGGHLNSSSATFIDGVTKVAESSLFVVVPPLGYLHTKTGFALGIRSLVPSWTPYVEVIFWIAVIGAFGAFIYVILWPYKTQIFEKALNFQSPIPMLLAIYLSLYTLIQPLVTFTPMDNRDAATALCLALPWLFAVLAALPVPRQYFVVAGYVGLNIIALGIFLVLRVTTPQLQEADPNFPSVYFNTFGWPNQLGHPPPRTLDLPGYHTDLIAHLQTTEPKAIITNAPFLLVAYPNLGTLGHRTSLSAWLEDGRCSSQLDVVIVLFDWYRWQAEAWPDEPHYDGQSGNPVELIEQKCPGIEKISVGHSIVYQLATAE